MFGSIRSVLMTVLLSAIALVTPTLAGTESWSTFFRDLLELPNYEAIIEEEMQVITSSGSAPQFQLRYPHLRATREWLLHGRVLRGTTPAWRNVRLRVVHV